MTSNWMMRHPLKNDIIEYTPHQYEEVKKHLQEMLDIGAIQ